MAASPGYSPGFLAYAAFCLRRVSDGQGLLALETSAGYDPARGRRAVTPGLLTRYLPKWGTEPSGKSTQLLHTRFCHLLEANARKIPGAAIPGVTDAEFASKNVQGKKLRWRKGMCIDETAFSVRKTKNLVQVYLDIIEIYKEKEYIPDQLENYEINVETATDREVLSMTR